tara:strand:+ start:896 stop:1591 length:696 start_codon:yes stop_codon:yes gene_type:complete
MNDKKSFQLFPDDGEETKEDIKAIKSNVLSIVILLLVIAGAVVVLVYAITRQSSEAPLRMTQDPNLRQLEPRQFMIDLVTSIRGFNDLLESIDEKGAFLDTEVAFVDFIGEMETIANQSLGPSKEPKEEEREELYKMMGELEIEVIRLEDIGQLKRSNRELWELIDPLYTRFESAMRMVPQVPPAGMQRLPPVKKPEVEDPEGENPEVEKPEVEKPEGENPEPIPDKLEAC